MSPGAHKALGRLTALLLCRGTLPSEDGDCVPKCETTPLLGHLLASRPVHTAFSHSLPGTKPLSNSLSMPCGNETENMVHPVTPTYTGVSVTTDEDVHVLLKAVTLGKLDLVRRRPPKEQQKGLVQSGNCFIFDEGQSKILRWTDSRKWVEKKVYGKFTVCSEVGSINTGSRFKKHTYRVQLDKTYYHIVAYSQDYSTLTPASRDPKLRLLVSGEDTQDCSTEDSVNTPATVTDVGDMIPFVHDQSWDYPSFLQRSPEAPRTSSQVVVPFPFRNSFAEPGYNLQAGHSFLASTQSTKYSPEYFYAFIEACPLEIPAQLTDDRQSYFSRFFSRVASRHTLPGSKCFAANETFALDYQGTPSVLAFLAVLREQFDILQPQQNSAGANKDCTELRFDFVVLPITNHNVSSTPLTWLAIQTLGSQFQSERLKRAAWALGQLPPGSHAPDSESFKWVRQIWTREPLRSGTRQVVDLRPGDDRQWSLLRHLKTRMYHPANLALNSELMAVLDEDLRRACRNSLQEWCIALAYELSQRPNDAEAFCYLYYDYMVQVAALQVDCFFQTGYTDVLHTCLDNPCRHSKPSLNDVKRELVLVVHSLVRSLVQSALQGQFRLYPFHPNARQLQLARSLGLQCYWLQVSYILLSPAERLHYDCLCRIGLNDLRANLTAKIGPGPVLIWNYLPDDVQAWTERERRLLEAKGF